MTYEPYRDEIFPIFIYYIILITFSAILTVAILRKWKERGTKPTLLLGIIFLLFSVAILVLMIGLGEAVFVGEFREIYRLSLPIAYSLMSGADIMVFRFANEITKKGRKGITTVVIIGFVLIAILFLPWNWWGVPSSDYAGEINIRIFSTMGLVIFSYIVYFYNISIFNKARKGAQKGVPSKGLTLLMYSIVCLVIFFVMMVCDTLLIVLTDHLGYSIFVYIAWSFAVLFYILSYLSIIMPNWLKKRIEG
ncbi:MAG: hypothetical protein ACTSUE_05710 [Promethearchaeota archaeon]